MDKQAVLHIPMSEYAHGITERDVVFRLRAGRDDLVSCRLSYGDRACRFTPVRSTTVEMQVVAWDAQFDYYEVTIQSPYTRICYYFELDDGTEQWLYYADCFEKEPVDERSDYYQLPFVHREDLALVPDWVHEAVVYNIFPDSFATGRRYISGEPVIASFQGRSVSSKLGGTIKGITENVDYLKDLCVNCIYINPIFAAGEYHKYDLMDYYSIDPSFGTNGDFKELVAVYHQNGIRVIIDGVFNHCGWYFHAFEDVVNNGAASRYADWFYRLEYPVIRPENPETYPDYECFGYERMMPKLNTANPEVVEYFCNVCRHWLREYGIDGWRLDVASEVNDDFWRAFRKAAKAENPQAILIGEVWETASHWLDGSMFDTSMNYDFRKHCRHFFATGRIDAQEFNGRVTNMLLRYRKGMLPAQLNVLDTHDVSRFLSLCGEEQARLKLAVLFQMCFVGIPCIFYGDEQGITGIQEAEYRSPMKWDTSDALYGFYQSCITLRRENPALQRGSFAALNAARGSMLYEFERRYNGDRVIVCINAGSGSVSVNQNGRLLLANGFDGASLAAYGYCVWQA